MCADTIPLKPRDIFDTPRDMTHNKILIVDDDRQFGHMVEKLLSGYGFECTVAYDGLAAYQILGTQHFDLVITDLDMPHLDGLALIGELTEHSINSIIIVVTGNGNVQQAVEAMKLGAYDFIEKPVRNDQLLQVVRRAILHQGMVVGNQQLRQLANKWEVTIDASPDMIAILDTDHRIIHSNKALIQYRGERRENINGRDFHQVLPAIKKIPVFPFPPEEGKEEIASHEIHDSDKGGDYLVTVAPLRHEDGSQWGTVVFVRDMTEYKLIQKQLLHSQKMESVGTLAAGVAHEINNPVGFISSNLNSLQRYLEKIKTYLEQSRVFIENVPLLNARDVQMESQNLKKLSESLKLDFILEDIQSLTEESREGTERIRRIVNSLKGFARNDDTQMMPANINERLEGVLNLTWNELKYKAQITKDYGEVPNISCCAADLDQVFVNLLINAVQAIPEKGEIRIRTWAESKWICVSISDTGTGIPKHVLSHIFEPFYTTKPVNKGTGLGLSISYDIVTKHGGELEVQSEENKGTTFLVKIPQR